MRWSSSAYLPLDTVGGVANLDARGGEPVADGVALGPTLLGPRLCPQLEDEVDEGPHGLGDVDGLARPGVEVSWVARKASASPATGSHSSHKYEQTLLCDQALS